MVAVMPWSTRTGTPSRWEAGEDLKVALTPTGTADSADYTLVGSFRHPVGEEMSNAVEIEVRGRGR